MIVVTGDKYPNVYHGMAAVLLDPAVSPFPPLSKFVFLFWNMIISFFFLFFLFSHVVFPFFNYFYLCIVRKEKEARGFYRRHPSFTQNPLTPIYTLFPF
jgi:hypothetical protein